MTNKWLAAIVAGLVWGVCAMPASLALAADEYRIEKLEDGPPADDLSAEVIEKLEPTGYKVVNANGRSVVEIWLAKELSVTEGPLIWLQL